MRDCMRCADRRAALIGGALLATNYAFVMWNRAALMESTMTAFIVAAGLRTRWPNGGRAWGFVAGICRRARVVHEGLGRVLRGALVIDALLTIALGLGSCREWLRVPRRPRPQRAGRGADARRHWPRGRSVVGRRCSCCRTGPSTASTTGR